MVGKRKVSKNWNNNTWNNNKYVKMHTPIIHLIDANYWSTNLWCLVFLNVKEFLCNVEFSCA